MPSPYFEASTPYTFLGILALFLASILILGAIGILSIGNIKVAQGGKTLAAGIILAIAGVVLLIPDFITRGNATSANETAFYLTQTALVSASSAANPTNTPATITTPTTASNTETPVIQPTRDNSTTVTLPSNTSLPSFTSTPNASPLPTSTATLVVSQATSPTTFGTCNPNPANPFDDEVVALNPEMWYVIEDYDNTASPPIHRFLAARGSMQVSANYLGGQRAWECSSEGVALSEAQRTANGHKRRNPVHQVFGPDGNEIP